MRVTRTPQNATPVTLYLRLLPDPVGQPPAHNPTVVLACSLQFSSQIPAESTQQARDPMHAQRPPEKKEQENILILYSAGPLVIQKLRASFKTLQIK